MNKRRESLDRAIVLFFCYAVNLIERVGPRNMIAENVPIPNSDFARGSSQPQSFLVLPQRFRAALALHELPDLTPNSSEHRQQSFVRLPNFRAEEFDYAQKLLVEHDRKSERRMQSFSDRDRSARKIAILADILNPGGFQSAPNSAG